MQIGRDEGSLQMQNAITRKMCLSPGHDYLYHESFPFIRFAWTAHVIGEFGPHNLVQSVATVKISQKFDVACHIQ